MSESSRLRSGVTVVLGILTGRATGLLRDLLLVSLFGAAALADAANLVLTLPDILTGLLVGGAMGAVLIPELQRLNDRGQRNLLWRATAVSFILFSVLAAVLALLSSPLIGILAPGLSPEVFELSRNAFSLTLVALPFSVLAYF